MPAYSQNYIYDGALTQEDIDQSVLYASPNDINQMEEGLTYMDQLIDPGGYTATTGCLDILENRQWGGDEGGNCANTGSGAGDRGSGVFTFGFNTTIISQTQDVIADALKVVGITVVGYRWEWRVKNADVNEYEAQNQNQPDTLIVTITVKDKQGNILDQRLWDYSEYIYDWENEYGMHWYDPFISGDKADTLTLEVEGKDEGYWAGWYGPEFGDAKVYSIFVVEPEKQDCTDPLLDPTCPAYGEALNAQQDEMLDLIANVTSTDVGSDDGAVAFVAEVTTVVEESVESVAETTEPQTEQPVDVAADPAPEETKEAGVEKTAESTTQSTGPSVNPLAIAQNAVASALEDANTAISNTLENTAQSVADANSINESIQDRVASSLDQLNNQNELEMSIVVNNAVDTVIIEQLEISDEQQLESEVADTVIIEQLEISDEQQLESEVADTGLTQQLETLDEQQLESEVAEEAQPLEEQQSNIVSFQSSVEQNNSGLNEVDELDNSVLINSEIELDGFVEEAPTTEIALEIIVDGTFEIAALDMAIVAAFNNIVQKDTKPQEKQEKEQPTEEQNEQEDALVAQALSGDESEDAQAALLGYNPNFRAYQQPQMPDVDFYKPRDIYEGQKNYDNPNQRFFNGASDQLHNQMVRSQYR